MSKCAALDELRFIDRNATNRLSMNAPEDPEILALCLKYGFGAVIDSASRQWCRLDPIGGFIYGAWGNVKSGLKRCREHDRARRPTASSDGTASK